MTSLKARTYVAGAFSALVLMGSGSTSSSLYAGANDAAGVAEPLPLVELCASCSEKTVYDEEGGTAQKHSFGGSDELQLISARRGDLAENRKCDPASEDGEGCHDTYRLGGCDSHYSCSGSGEAEELTGKLLRAAEAGDVRTFWQVANSNPDRVSYNPSRKALQVTGCAGLFAHIPVAAIDRASAD